MDGLRKCLVEEFSSLYIFHLRGNQRTSGERSRKEGGKIFDSGSRAPIAISLLVKNPDANEHGKIYFHDIGDYINRLDKLKIIQEFKSLNGITQENKWTEIIPDQFGDWINQRDPNFDNYLSLGDKKDKTSISLFSNFSQGVLTSRDAWCYNFDKSSLTSNIQRMITTYDSDLVKTKDQKDIENIIDLNPSNISWSRALKNLAKKGTKISFVKENIRLSSYRPYTKSNLYFDRSLNEMVYQIPQLFPTPLQKNLAISIVGRGETAGFSTLISDIIPNYHFMASSQCFPLYLYEKKNIKKENDDIFNQDNDTAQEDEYTRKDAITDEALKHFQDAYPDNPITKEDLFYYIYGLLHSEEYREKYADNLTKQLPRIPRVKTYKDFAHFSNAGRELAELHLNYETINIYDKVKLKGKNGYTATKQAVKGGADSDYYVTKMKFGKKKDPETGKNVNDLSTVIYNNFITIENIPEEAYDYIVNGKPALEWVMERQSVTTHKASGITNDANDWAIETMKNARYPLELFLRVITVSLETQKIVNSLPKLDLLKD